jgi:MFS family permease
LFQNVETILPNYVALYHEPPLSEIYISFIMISFEIVGVIGSSFVGLYLEKFGRKNFIIAGYVIIVIFSVLLALTELFPPSHKTGMEYMGYLYFGTCVIARCGQGLGNICIHVTCYSILTSVFSDNREKYIGYGEAATGFGLMLGPVLGGILNSTIGYMGAFLVFAGMLFVFGVLAFVFIPNSLNKSL